jgi:hypothetical protein
MVSECYNVDLIYLTRTAVNNPQSPVVSQFEFLLGLTAIDQMQDIGHIPQRGGKSCGHRRTSPNRLMEAGEVVPHEIEGESMAMVFQLLRKRIRQSRKASEGHPRGEVMPFNIAGRDMLPCRVTLDRLGLDPDAFGRAAMNAPDEDGGVA